MSESKYPLSSQNPKLDIDKVALMADRAKAARWSGLINKTLKINDRKITTKREGSSRLARRM